MRRARRITTRQGHQRVGAVEKRTCAGDQSRDGETSWDGGEGAAGAPVRWILDSVAAVGRGSDPADAVVGRINRW